MDSPVSRPSDGSVRRLNWEGNKRSAWFKVSSCTMKRAAAGLCVSRFLMSVYPTAPSKLHSVSSVTSGAHRSHLALIAGTDCLDVPVDRPATNAAVRFSEIQWTQQRASKLEVIRAIQGPEPLQSRLTPHLWVKWTKFKLWNVYGSWIKTGGEDLICGKFPVLIHGRIRLWLRAEIFERKVCSLKDVGFFLDQVL